MFGTILILKERVVPLIPLSEDEQLAINIYENALREFANGKRDVDSRGSEKAGSTSEDFRSEEGRKDHRKRTEESRKIKKSKNKKARSTR